jgi:hypothetical protein
MTRRRARALALASVTACAGTAACVALLHGWLAPDNVLAFWALVAWCR